MSKKEPCRLVIKPAQRMNISGDIMTRYVQECIGKKFKFFLDEVECEDGKQCQFTFIFESRNQGKKAATILKENAVKKIGKELQVTVLKEVEGDSSPAARTAAFLDAALPIYAKKSLIIETIKDNQACIVLGKTGSGKSTQMTQYLYEAGFAEKGVIVCTQPQKVAATSLADHVAHEMGGVCGQIVGCHVGGNIQACKTCLLYTSPSPRDQRGSRMPSSA